MLSKFSDIPRACFVLLVVLFGLGVGGWFWWNSPRTNVPVLAEATIPVEVNDLGFAAESRSARYVGSQACATCHADVCELMAHSAHGQSLNDVDLALEPTDGEFEDFATGCRYRVYRQGNELRHREFLKVDDREVILADYPMRYTIGSGNHARSYLVEVGEYLVESPATWYVAPARWNLSPGYDQDNSGFARPINFECLFCHTGHVEAIAGARTHLKIHSMKIDCERCHGPGSSHVEFRTAGKLDAVGDDATIVNPARLNREKNEATCAQCHLNGDAVVNRQGKHMRDYRPGDSIQDFCIHYSLRHSKNSLTIVGHVEQLRRSRCHQQSATLTCITCHNPHAKLAAGDQLTHYRQTCLSCHEDKPCGMELSRRLAKSAGDSCVVCHMPKHSSEVPHLAATQHQIGIRWNPDQDEPLGAGTLVPLDDLSGLDQAQQDRNLGLAYLDLSLKDGRPTTSNVYRQRAQELLERVLNQGISDSELLVGLAQTYQRRNLQRSIELAERGLQIQGTSFETRVRGLSTIADSHVAQRETSRAIPLFEQLTTMRRQSADWYRLSACRLHAGELPEALQAARNAVQIRPNLPNPHALLAEVYKQSNQPELARIEEQLEQWLKNAARGKPKARNDPSTSDPK